MTGDAERALTFDEIVAKYTTFVFDEGSVSVETMRAHIKRFAEEVRPRVAYDEALLDQHVERHNELARENCALETRLGTALLIAKHAMTNDELDKETQRLSVEVSEAVLSPVKTSQALIVANDALKELWSQWADFYTKHFRAAGVALSMADKQAFFEIGQPIMMDLATRSRL